MITGPGRDRFTDEGAPINQRRIIGVELAVRDAYGTEHELQMFECQHTLPPTPAGAPHQIRVTLHTSHGDISLYAHTH